MIVPVEMIVKALLTLKPYIQVADFPPPNMRFNNAGLLEIDPTCTTMRTELGKIEVGLRYSSVQSFWFIEEIIFSDYRIKQSSPSHHFSGTDFVIECETGEPDLEEAFLKLYLLLPALEQ
jgi:hypothetical protein